MKRDQKNNSVIVLAGGNSARMGFPKSWLKTKGGSTFLAEIVGIFKQFGINDIVVVLNHELTTNKWKKEVSNIEGIAKVVKNHKVDCGRLFSIQLGLNHVKSDNVFIHNVDNPFIEQNTLDQLSQNMNCDGITIPSFRNKGGHPVLINKTVKDYIIKSHQNIETLKDAFLKFPKKYVEVESRTVLTNINTPVDYMIEVHGLV